MSHLACADTPRHPLNQPPARALRRDSRSASRTFPASLANSAGILLGTDYHFDMVRPGIALYGADFAEDYAPLAPVVTLEARDPPGPRRRGRRDGRLWRGETLARDSRIAILAAGYADGYLRSAELERPTRRAAQVLLRGRRARIVGRVSMDLMAADVTDIPEACGPAIGRSCSGRTCPIDEVAAAAGTIGYELLTGLSRRAQRIYLNGPGSA